MATAQPTVAAHDGLTRESAVAASTPPAALGVVRMLLGFVFLWSFLDTTFGLYSTARSESWLAGESPTAGYLGSLEGTFAGVFQAMAGLVWVDWMYMLGMGLVGAALLLGITMRLAAIGAVALMGALYLTSMPLEHNPIVDEHLVYAVLAVALASTHAGHVLGAGGVWSRLPLVRRTWLLR
jgi:thiosulfate dehydrogenase (quinone) large subunit